MPFNIDQFHSKINQREGIMPTSRFMVRFPAPTVLLGQDDGAAKDMEFWCEQVTFPGFMIVHHDIRRYTYGPTEKRPFGPNFTQCQCIFMNNNAATPWKYFSKWMNYIMPHDMTGGIGDNSIPYNNRMYPYQVEYKVNYATDIHIYVFDQGGQLRQRVVLREAFPSQLIDTQLAWAQQNDIFRFQVAFEFVDWYIIDENQGD